MIGMLCIRLCPDNRVSVKNSATGNTVQGKPEWKLALTTDCPCSQMNLKLSCAGFEPIQEPDPTIFNKYGDTCSVTISVSAFSPITLTYVADTMYDFHLISSKSAC